VAEAAEAERKEEAVMAREHTREEIAEFLTACEPGAGIGVHLRDGRDLAGDCVSFDGDTLRLELSGGRPKFNWLGERRPDGPVVEIDFDEIVSVIVQYVIEDRPRATSRDTAWAMSEETVKTPVYRAFERGRRVRGSDSLTRR
jgi:hypothetical protein